MWAHLCSGPSQAVDAAAADESEGAARAVGEDQLPWAEVDTRIVRNAVKRSLLQLSADIASKFAMEAALEASVEEAAVVLEAAAAMEPAKTSGLSEEMTTLLLPTATPPEKDPRSEQRLVASSCSQTSWRRK